MNLNGCCGRANPPWGSENDRLPAIGWSKGSDLNDRQFQFAWDEFKAARNLRKYGNSFELASTVFNDPRILSINSASPPASATAQVVDALVRKLAPRLAAQLGRIRTQRHRGALDFNRVCKKRRNALDRLTLVGIRSRGDEKSPHYGARSDPNGNSLLRGKFITDLPIEDTWMPAEVDFSNAV